ncbi:MAG: serine hydrolase [Anaerolineae bacterium]
MLASDLPRTTPEQQGIASAGVLQLVEALESQLKEIHSVMLLRHGCVAAEGWWLPYGREHRHSLFSLSKSFTATAVGLALMEGHFGIDDPVLSFFPDETPADGNDLLAAIRVRHLLSMSTGHADDTWGHMLARPDGNWIKAFFDVPVVHAPGTHFLYNTGATYMLSAIVQRTTGMKLVDYLQPRLFQPLGIEDATWEESPQGINMGGIGLSIRTEDVARFGQLYLQKGMWQGQQLLPEAWTTEATTTQIANDTYAVGDWAQGYGYQFWRCRHNAYRGDGVFGQFCVVMPEQDAVLAITAGIDVFDAQQMLDIVWEKLLPTMGEAPLMEDAAAYDLLTQKLATLMLPTAQGRSSSPLAARVSGKTYGFDDNELNLERITLSFAANNCTVTFKSAANVETIPCGYGDWQRGQTTLFTHMFTPVACSGAWTADDCFTMIIRLYETPFFYTLVYHLEDDELMLEAQVSVSLDSTKPLLLTAHRL